MRVPCRHHPHAMPHMHMPRTHLHDLEGGDVTLPPDGPAEDASEVVVVHDHVHARVEEQADELQALRVLQPEPSHHQHLGVEGCRLGDVTRAVTAGTAASHRVLSKRPCRSSRVRSGAREPGESGPTDQVSEPWRRQVSTSTRCSTVAW